MPTGYTEGVASGRITEFREYAMGCARAFGALISMRDDPQDTEIPEQFTPSTYNSEAVAKAEAELAKIENATPAQIKMMSDTEQEAERSRIESYLTERREQKQRYERMLAKARRYTAPTGDHIDFAKFLVRQLEESIKFDCSHEYPIPPVIPPDEWKAEQVRNLTELIEWNKKRQEEENERVESRNRWMMQLRESLRDFESSREEND